MLQRQSCKKYGYDQVEGKRFAQEHTRNLSGQIAPHNFFWRPARGRLVSRKKLSRAGQAGQHCRERNETKQGKHRIVNFVLLKSERSQLESNRKIGAVDIPPI